MILLMYSNWKCSKNGTTACNNVKISSGGLGSMVGLKRLKIDIIDTYWNVCTWIYIHVQIEQLSHDSKPPMANVSLQYCARVLSRSHLFCFYNEQCYNPNPLGTFVANSLSQYLKVIFFWSRNKSSNDLAQGSIWPFGWSSVHWSLIKNSVSGKVKPFLRKNKRRKGWSVPNYTRTELKIGGNKS